MKAYLNDGPVDCTCSHDWYAVRKMKKVLASCVVNSIPDVNVL